MPRYYFDVKDGTRLADPSGLDCRDDADALCKARFIAEQIARSAPHHSSLRQIQVLNEEGEEISIVPVHLDQE
jgi:hypothetical protein